MRLSHFELIRCRYKHAAKHMNKESFLFFHLRMVSLWTCYSLSMYLLYLSLLEGNCAQADLHNKWLMSEADKRGGADGSTALPAGVLASFQVLLLYCQLTSCSSAHELLML